MPAGPTTSGTKRSKDRSGAGPIDAQVEYRLVRNAVVEEFRSGRRTRAEVCDTHPELVRAARNIGRPTGEDCPICEVAGTVEVTFVFGARLPPGGTCPGTKSELRKLTRRQDPVVCYCVEVCPGCGWHHLIRRYPAGGVVPRPAGKGDGRGKGMGS